MSEPVLARSISKRCLREKCRRQKITNRSQRKCQWSIGDLGSPTMVRVSLSLSRTNIFAFTPLLLSAFIKRLASTAAPPVRSLVLTIRTLMQPFPWPIVWLPSPYASVLSSVLSHGAFAPSGLPFLYVSAPFQVLSHASSVPSAVSSTLWHSA